MVFVTETALIVHGGAGELPEHLTKYPARKPYEQGLAAALRAGQKVLTAGGNALDAVCDAVSSLEDNPLFNAGHGAVLCADGTIELSASVMSGEDRKVGAMVGLKHTRNPVRGARALLDHVHGLLFGEHADLYAEAAGVQMVSADYFMTPQRRAQWEKVQKTGDMVLDHSSDADAHGTVGAVALDQDGNLAAATSTGGIVNQLPGRVGDTPVVGAGTWADNAVCALSATGKGDEFARVAFARRVADLVEIGGLSYLAAAERSLEDVGLAGGEGGCILLTPSGDIICPFTSAQMLRGWIRGDGPPRVAILAGEDVVVA